jgi:hypothetical protein
MQAEAVPNRVAEVGKQKAEYILTRRGPQEVSETVMPVGKLPTKRRPLESAQIQVNVLLVWWMQYVVRTRR